MSCDFNPYIRNVHIRGAKSLPVAILTTAFLVNLHVYLCAHIALDLCHACFDEVWR